LLRLRTTNGFAPLYAIVCKAGQAVEWFLERAIDSRTYKSSRLLARYILHIRCLNNIKIKARCTKDLIKYIASCKR
jgi:hypothetical protein